MNKKHNGRTQRVDRRGVTRLEVVACLTVGMVALAAILPLAAAGRSLSREHASLANLKTLAIAHASYAADWDGRQFTNMPEGMSAAGGSYSTYVSMFGRCPPSATLGFGSSFPAGGTAATWAFWLPCGAGVGLPGNFSVIWPAELGTPTGGGDGFGMCRLQNAVGFNEYVNGRFMDPVFYAPADARNMALVGPGLESPNPFTNISASDGTWSSYMASPAAMYHPGVFGGDSDQMFKSPYTFVQGSISPTVDQCAHPDLKTRLIEGSWLQSPPQAAFFDTISPYFNHGADSVPMTLFFDGHAAPMPIRKVLADNDAIVKGGGAELWMDTEITVGPWAALEGYYSNLSIDDTRTSVHVFTREGILGRDVTSAP